MGLLGFPLLALGFALGLVVYLAVAYALLRGVRLAVAGLLALYWEWRTRADSAAAQRRVARVQSRPGRSGASPRRSRRPA